MKAAIFANGEFTRSPFTDMTIDQANLIIAADGGANHCKLLNITPDVLVGDLDSVSSSTLAEYQQSGVPVKRFPEQKDATDLELALDYAVARGALEITILGCLGGRWDMSLANILLLSHSKYTKVSILLCAEKSRIQVLFPGKHTLIGNIGQRISLLPLGQECSGISLEGFQYPLVKAVIPLGSTLGVSNVICHQNPTVFITKGKLLCIFLDI